MNQITLPAEVVQEDLRLDEMASTAKTALAELRWHWTLDESNPKRVSIREYARQVGRYDTTVGQMVHGYVSWKAEQVHGLGRAPDTSWSTLDDHIVKARAGQTRTKAAEILADSTGRRPASILKNSSSDVTELVVQATEAATRRGTDTEHEMERIIEVRKKAAEVTKKHTEEDRAKKDLQYIALEGDISAAMRHMKKVLERARTVALTEEHIELISDSLNNMRALMNLIDMQLTGSVAIDWDAELAKIGGTQ